MGLETLLSIPLNRIPQYQITLEVLQQQQQQQQQQLQQLLLLLDLLLFYVCSIDVLLLLSLCMTHCAC
jgi:hypothetical protein